MVEAADADLPKKIDAILSIESLYATAQGVRGCRILVLTHSDTTKLLQVASLSAVIVHERIARQTQYIIGKRAYTLALLMQESRICLPYPVYAGFSLEDIFDNSDVRRLEDGEELPLKQCSPLLDAHTR